MSIRECKDIFALLSQYLDEELPDDVCREIDAHLSGCAACVQFVESLKKTIEFCRNCPSPECTDPLPDSAREELYAAYQKMLAARKKGEC